MATKSVATKQRNADIPGSEHDLWLAGGKRCLTVRLDRNSRMSPPDFGSLEIVHDTLTGLGKAVQIVAKLVEDGEASDEWSTGLALNGLANAIVHHAQLATAINGELRREDAAMGAA